MSSTTAIAQLPASVDIAVYRIAGQDSMEVRVRPNGASFNELVSALTFTIRWETSSGASLGSLGWDCGIYCNWLILGLNKSPDGEIDNGGFRYQTFNGFSGNQLSTCTPPNAPPFLCTPLGTAYSWAADQEVVVMKIGVLNGSDCANFNVVNDAFTNGNNKDFYISLNGQGRTGAITSDSVPMGPCAVDICPVISSISSNSPICSDAPLILNVVASGTEPLSYTWSGVGTISNNNAPNTMVTDAATGDYTMTITNSCGNTSTTVPVVVTAAPSATISYAGSPFCTEADIADVTVSGTDEGVFTSTAGLSIHPGTGAIDPSLSEAGTYTVAYTIAASGGCSVFQTTTNVSINNSFTAIIDYTGSPFCSAAGVVTVTQSGTQGGSYSASPSGLFLDPVSGLIDPGMSNAGSYDVTYSIAASGGCPAFSTSTLITISATPAASISYAEASYCLGPGFGTVTVVGSLGGLFSADPIGLAINAGTGHIDLEASGPGEYIVTYSIAPAGGCPAWSTTTDVELAAAPVAGNNTVYVVCQDADPFELFPLLGTADPGGQWTGPDGMEHGEWLYPATDQSGAYTYLLIASAPCSDAAAVVTVVIDLCVGLEDHRPNPTVRWLGQQTAGMHLVSTGELAVVEWTVHDHSGRIIQNSAIRPEGGLLHVPLAHAASGQYMLRMRSGSGTHVLRLVHIAH